MLYKAIIKKFKSYRKTHPHLANLWIAYLGLKKKHCEELVQQAQKVFAAFEKGQADIKKKDIVSILLYSMMI
jgi:predicted secreted Zn-dependent protease